MIFLSPYFYRHIFIAIFLLPYFYRHIFIAIFLSPYFYRHIVIAIFLTSYFHRHIFIAIFLSLYFYRHIFIIIFLSSYFYRNIFIAIFLSQYFYRNMVIARRSKEWVDQIYQLKYLCSVVLHLRDVYVLVNIFLCGRHSKYYMDLQNVHYIALYSAKMICSTSSQYIRVQRYSLWFDCLGSRSLSTNVTSNHFKPVFLPVLHCTKGLGWTFLLRALQYMVAKSFRFKFGCFCFYWVFFLRCNA